MHFGFLYYPKGWLSNLAGYLIIWYQNLNSFIEEDCVPVFVNAFNCQCYHLIIDVTEGGLPYHSDVSITEPFGTWFFIILHK